MAGTPLTLHGHGVVLREWTDADLPVMTELFDEPSVERWTPLETPFTLGAAGRYLARAREARSVGRAVQLAITTDGAAALGEVLLFGLDEDDAELGYAVGRAYRGRGLAARSVRVMSEYAFDERGLERLVLRIPPGNLASGRVAAAAGFALTDEPLVAREAKGRSVELATWERLAPPGSVAVDQPSR